MNKVFATISAVLKVFAWLSSLLWKNKNIIYLNSNKKTCNIDEICRNKLVDAHDAKIINIEKYGTTHFKQYKAHFRRMQYHLYQIKRNLSSNRYFVYGGFVSPMFAVFDGAQIGNNVKTDFICYDNNANEYYLVNYHRSSSNSPCGVDLSGYVGEVINIIISSTYKVVPCKCDPTIKTFEFEERLEGRVTNEYLQRVYAFVESILVGTQTSSIRKINMYKILICK